MKKVLLIVGILIIIVGILSLLFALLNMQGYYNLRDGSSQLYNKLHQRMITYSITGIILELVGIVCFIIRFRI